MNQKSFIARKELQIAHNQKMVNWLKKEISNLECIAMSNPRINKRIASYKCEVLQREERITRSRQELRDNG